MTPKKFISDTRKLSGLDKLRAYYIEGKPLSEKQEFKRVQYEQAHSLRILGMSREQTVKMLISRNIVGSSREAYRIVGAAEELYGEINKVNKDGMRHLLTENLMRIYNRSMELQDLKNANKANELIAKINNLVTHTEITFDFSKLTIPVPVYTSDPKVLIQQETLDIDHEEMDE